MKKLTKLAATALAGVALFIGTTANAQTTPKSKLRFGLGLEAGVPTGDAHYSSNFELGGTARLQYGVGDRFALMLTSGYYNFFGKDYTTTLPNGSTIAVDGKSYGLIPVKAGMKAFFTDNIYFSAEAGAGFETSGAKNTKLILSPGLGWANQKWDVGVRYEDFSGQSNNYGIVGVRLAYGFEL